MSNVVQPNDCLIFLTSGFLWDFIFLWIFAVCCFFWHLKLFLPVDSVGTEILLIQLLNLLIELKQKSCFFFFQIFLHNQLLVCLAWLKRFSVKTSPVSCWVLQRFFFSSCVLWRKAVWFPSSLCVSPRNHGDDHDGVRRRRPHHRQRRAALQHHQAVAGQTFAQHVLHRRRERRHRHRHFSVVTGQGGESAQCSQSDQCGFGLVDWWTAVRRTAPTANLYVWRSAARLAASRAACVSGSGVCVAVCVLAWAWRASLHFAV